MVHLGDGSCASRDELEALPPAEARRVISHACPKCEEAKLLEVINAGGAVRSNFKDAAIVRKEVAQHRIVTTTLEKPLTGWFNYCLLLASHAPLAFRRSPISRDSVNAC